MERQSSLEKVFEGEGEYLDPCEGRRQLMVLSHNFDAEND